MRTSEKVSSLGSLVATISSISPMKVFPWIWRALTASGLVFLVCSSLVSSDTNCQPMSSALAEKNRPIDAGLSLSMIDVRNDSTTWLIAVTSAGRAFVGNGVVWQPASAKQQANSQVSGLDR